MPSGRKCSNSGDIPARDAADTRARFLFRSIIRSIAQALNPGTTMCGRFSACASIATAAHTASRPDQTMTFRSRCGPDFFAPACGKGGPEIEAGPRRGGWGYPGEGGRPRSDYRPPARASRVARCALGRLPIRREQRNQCENVRHRVPRRLGGGLAGAEQAPAPSGGRLTAVESLESKSGISQCNFRPRFG